MTYLSGYVKNIVYFMLFATFVGIIAPHSKYKQYISLMLGLVLIIIVVEPFGNWLGGEALPVSRVFAGIGSSSGEEAAGLSQYEGIQLEMIRKTYNQYAEKQIKALIGGGFNVVSAEVVTTDDLGEITEISVKVKKEESTEKEKGRPLIRIEPISRRSSEAEQEEPYADEMKKMKKVISDFYNLSVDNIHISVEVTN